MKDDFDSKTKEILDNIEDLNKKMDEIEEEGSYDDEESDQDLDSELGDTLDVNAIDRPILDRDKVSDTSPAHKHQSAHGGSNDYKGG